MWGAATAAGGSAAGRAAKETPSAPPRRQGTTSQRTSRSGTHLTSGYKGRLPSLDRGIAVPGSVAAMRRPTADLMLLATVSLWALNFTVSKYILDEGLHALSYSSVRYGAAALVFAAVTLAWEGSLRIARRDLPFAAGCVVVLFANQLCFVYALDLTTATTTALLFGTLPIWTGLLARGTGVAVREPPALPRRGRRADRPLGEDHDGAGRRWPGACRRDRDRTEESTAGARR